MTKIEDLPMWGVKEVAHYFRISRSSVYDMSKIPKRKGGPPVCRIGAIIRFPTQEFLAWAKETKPFSSVRPNRKRKRNVLNDNRFRRVPRPVDVAV
jgi:hypothetical protein